MVDCDIFPKKYKIIITYFNNEKYGRKTCMMLDIMSGADGSHSLFTSCENP